MKKILALLALTLLCACETAPAGYEAKPFTYAPPLRLNVREIRVVNNAATSTRLPHVEADFPTPLLDATQQWATQRLIAAPDASSASVLEVSIEDATALANKLPTKKGVEGMFYDQQDTRIDASLKITMRLYTPASALSVAEGNVEVTRSRTLNEKATVSQRQAAYDQMAHDMMSALDSQAELRLRQYFRPYVR